MTEHQVVKKFENVRLTSAFELEINISNPDKLFTLKTAQLTESGVVYDFEGDFNREYDNRRKHVTRCANGFMRGECINGHSFARLMLCNKEYCEDCGKKGSHAHKQRIGRWWDKVLQMDSVGYLVVTIPEQLRGVFLNKKKLSEFRTYFKRKLIRLGYSRGFCRYHWAGDCEKCKGKGCLFCNNTGASDVYAPHLNFLIEGKFIDPKELDKWRSDLTIYLNSHYSQYLRGEKVVGNMYYGYGKAQGFKIHKLKYVTRATWRYGDRSIYAHILDIIKGFRTSMQWGKFEKTKENTSDVIKLLNNKCPCCNSQIKWGGFISIEKYLYQDINLKNLDAGFFQVQEIIYDPPN